MLKSAMVSFTSNILVIRIWRLSTNDYVLNKQTWEICLANKITMEIDSVVDSVENMFPEAYSALMDSILIPGIDLPVRPINESCRRDVAGVAESSESEKQSGITTTL